MSNPIEYIVKIDKDGNKFWYRNGQYHREDGPACEYANGTRYWFIEGKEYTEQEFNKKMNKTSCGGKIVEIDGKKYKLVESD